MASEDQDVLPTTALRPAWPALALMQLAVLVVLFAAVRLAAPPPSPPLDVQLQQLDIDQTIAVLDEAIARADTGRALAESDEVRAARFLSLQAQAAGMRIGPVTFRPGIAADGVRPVDAKMTLEGDPYHLPIFLDGLYRQRAINHPLSVRGEGAGRAATFTVLLRYYRPAQQDLEWIQQKLERQAPARLDRRPVLEAAARLGEWRLFRAAEHRLVSEAGVTREEVARALAARLIALRRSGGELSWRHSDGGEGAGLL